MSGTLKKFDTSNIIVVKYLKDHSNDPYFVKKTEEVRALLKKSPIPESFKKKEKITHATSSW